MTRGELDRADLFVRAATRAFALSVPCPAPPADHAWVARAADAGVLPVVLSAMRASGHPVPPSSAALSMSIAARELRTMEDLGTVGPALTEAGMAWSALKGPVLSDIVFSRRHTRDYADLDLLVSPKQVRRAIEVLLQTGATVFPTDWDVATGAGTAELSMVLRHGTMLDLHWSIFNLGHVRAGFPVRTDDLLATRTARAIDGVEVFTLDDLDLVLHTLSHACLSGCSSLRWLLDAQQCVTWLRATPRELGERARERGLDEAARAVLESVALHLDDSVRPWSEAMGPPTAWTRTLRRVSRRRPPSAPSVTSRSSHTFYASTRSTTARSLLALARTAVLTVRYARAGWPEPSPRPAAVTDDGFEAWVRVAEAQR